MFFSVPSSSQTAVSRPTDSLKSQSGFRFQDDSSYRKNGGRSIRYPISSNTISFLKNEYLCICYSFQQSPHVSALIAKCDDANAAEDKDVLKVVKMLDQACKEAGFFYVKGHGISDSLIKEVKDVTRSFFCLPYEDKAKIKMSSSTGFRGYQQVGENITKGKPDMHEAIDYYKEVKPQMLGELGKALEGFNPWPRNSPKLKVLMEEYVGLLKELARKIMRGIALALGGQVDAFEGQRAGDPFWIMRLIGYPGSTNSVKLEKCSDDVGCGSHTDYGLLTLVNQDDDINALQVQNHAGGWISAVPIPGTFVCNIGDMLKIWSNGEYESTLHRVINNSTKYRVSVAFFYEPNFEAIVEPLEVCKERAGGLAKFGTVVYGEHLVRKVLTNFVY